MSLYEEMVRRQEEREKEEQLKIEAEREANRIKEEKEVCVCACAPVCECFKCTLIVCIQGVYKGRVLYTVHALSILKYPVIVSRQN